MTNKELILGCLLDDDEAFTQIVEAFQLEIETKLSSSKIKKTLSEMVKKCLIQDDEPFMQIVESLELTVMAKISTLEIKKLLSEMVKEGYLCINYSWKNEHDEYPYSLTEKGKKEAEKVWEDV